MHYYNSCNIELPVIRIKYLHTHFICHEDDAAECRVMN